MRGWNYLTPYPLIPSPPHPSSTVLQRRIKKGHGTPILRCAMTSILIRSGPCRSALPVGVVSANPADGLKPKLTIVRPLLTL